MKLITPEISWHQKEPIFSVDFCPQTWKLATCGADFTVKIWLAKEKEDGDNSIGIEFLANLDRHAKAVNVVRFSPNGSILASAGDDGTIILWKLNENEKGASDVFLDEDVVNKENWMVYKMLRGHIEDVYDLAWSPDSTQLISGSVDNSAIIWDAVKGQSQKILTDHKHYVQGVCWDPRSFYVATHSSDRSCRLYATSNHKCLFNIQKNTMSYEKNGVVTKTKYSRMFMDETMQSFFRRCTFSTDGSFLFLPAGLCDGDDKPKKTTYVFARGHYRRPIRHLPGGKKATVAVKCSPVVYELIEDKENQAPLKQNNEYFKVPYRMVYAVASLDCITIYDTQHDLPIGYCANMHYASLTDITWSSDGKLIVISSTDGYCSFIKFEEGELGTPIIYDPIEYQVTQAKIRKKNKRDSKKKELKKPETDTPEDKKTEEVEKKAISPQSVDTPKEKEKETPVKTVVDRKQPTIDKLFVTPIRKRKRATDGSPNGCSDNKKSATPENGGTPSSTTSPPLPVTKTPSNMESEIKETEPALNSPLTHKQLSSQKPPKRIQVVTLSIDEEKPGTNPSISAVNPPKRVNVQTPSSDTSGNSQSNSLISLDKTPRRVNVTTLTSITSGNTPSNPLISPAKTPRRVNVTTLSSNTSINAQANPLPSPNKTPRRVNVTTLSSNTPGNRQANLLTSPDKSPRQVISLISPTKPPKRVTVTSLSSTNTEKSQTNLLVSPQKTVSNSMISPNKPPKRVNVTTLVTFPSNSKMEEPVITGNQSITPSKAIYSGNTPLSPVVQANTSASPVVHTEKSQDSMHGIRAVKPPKRVTVQTLSTFSDVAKSTEIKGKSREIQEGEVSTASCIPVSTKLPPVNDIISTTSFDPPSIDTVITTITLDDTKESEGVKEVAVSDSTSNVTAPVNKTDTHQEDTGTGNNGAIVID